MATPKKSDKGDGNQKNSVDDEAAMNEIAKPNASLAPSEIHSQELEVSWEDTSADTLVYQAKKIVVDHMESAFEALGNLFLFGPFEGAWREVINGKPTKNPIMKKVLAHKDVKQHRNRFLEALFSAAVAKEWDEKGLQFPSATYSHRNLLARIKDENQRLAFAEKVQNEHLSVRDLKDEIRDYMLSLESPALVQGQQLVRKIKTLVGFLKDRETMELLMNRQRLEFIDDDSRSDIFKYSKQGKRMAVDFQDLFGKVSDTIIEIETSGNSDSKDDEIQEDSAGDSGDDEDG